MVSQLQEATLTKSEAQKAVQEIRALQKLADTEESNNSTLRNQLERCKVGYEILQHFKIPSKYRLGTLKLS